MAVNLAQEKRKHVESRPLPVSRIRVYWLLRQRPWLTLKEVARILGISYNAAKKAHSRLKRDGDKVSCYCPLCLKNSVIKEGKEVLCTSCGTVLLEEDEIFFHGKDGYPTNFIQRNRGLGSSVETENALIRALGLKHISMGQVQRLGFSEPKFYTAVKKRVIELGGFQEWDNEITNIIGRLTEIKCELVLITRCEITRKTIRDTALEVLAEAYKVWPNRIHIPQNVLDEMRKKGLIGDTP
ncbi:MAG: hypothetical protein H5T50_05000 [Nitrososphaeria archaeon]|nr:hypothetical protein [Nitrososphaeria archaeon]